MQVALYQLANDRAEYGHYALGWIVVSPDGGEEFSLPFKWREDAERFVTDMGWTLIPVEESK